MRVRLGYACLSETIDDTSSHSYSYTSFLKEQDYQKLQQIIIKNLQALEQILIYNKKNNIHFFRISSQLIPLATKKEVVFDYVKSYQEWYQKIGKLLRKNSMRVDFHPNEYCVLNSVKEEVVQNSIQILNYLYQLLENFQVQSKVLVLHIGSNVFGKEKAMERFCRNFKRLDYKIQQAIAIENDDKIFTIDDCLELHQKIGVAVVFDYHHHLCNPGKLSFDEFMGKVLSSWKKDIPKIHFSSPKSKIKKDFRSHHDYIDSSQFILFLEQIKKYNQDIDIMIEAKKKDEAMFRLIRELKYKCSYSFIDETTFMLDR